MKTIKDLSHEIKSRFARLTLPIVTFARPVLDKISSTARPLTNQVMKVWRPFNAKYLELTQPIRDWHKSLSLKSPLLANSIAWSYKLFRYGFNTLLLLILMTMIGLFGHMPSKKDLQNIENSNTSEVYTQDSVLIGRYFIENRTEISLDKISPYIITALLAVEDKRFFEHSGIDFWSWLRVFKGVATNVQNLGGGSTLSQQLAKNLYPRKNFIVPGVSMLINKIRENIISMKLESIYNKEDLLILYLNTVPFGGDRFGINVASRYFYNKKAKDLTASESATLIGMLKATTALDPTRNPNNSKARRNVVLKRMLENSSFSFKSTELPTVTRLIANGKITAQDYEEMIKRPVSAKRYLAEYESGGKGAYFREYLRTYVLPRILKSLVKQDGSRYNLYRDGLKIYTTLDSRMQNYAEDAVGKHMQSLQSKFNKHWTGVVDEKAWGDDKWIDEQVVKSDRFKLAKEREATDEEIRAEFDQKVNMTIFSWKNGGGDADTIMSPRDSIIHYFTMLNTGFLAMDHTNGYIKSWVGGTNFKYFKYDHILSSRQVGSTFKPIVYAAAIKDSIKPCDYYRNEQITIEDWSPRNADYSYGGWASVLGGLTYSINSIAARLISIVGIQKTIELATAMGVTSTMPREFGIALGAADITLYDMIKVYGTIANKGVRPEPVAILKIVDRNGTVIYDYDALLKSNPLLGAHVQALTEDEAAIMTKMMQSVIDNGTGRKFRASGAVGEYAGKTGTTQNHADGWFIVFNPQIVSGAWVGGPSPAVRFRSMDLGQGSAMALPIVSEFWKAVRSDSALKKMTDTRFEENEVAMNLVGCHLRIPFSPDTLDLIMSDSLLGQDSISHMGYSDLENFYAQKFGVHIDEMEGDSLHMIDDILEGEPDVTSGSNAGNAEIENSKTALGKGKLVDKNKKTGTDNKTMPEGQSPPKSTAIPKAQDKGKNTTPPKEKPKNIEKPKGN